MIIVVLLFFVSVFYYALFRRSRRRLYELADQIPGVDPLPVISNLHLCVGGPRRMLRNIVQFCDGVIERGGVCKTWLGPKLYVVITKPEDAQIVLENCLQKDFVYKFLRAWLGNGLFVSTYHPWKMQRRIMLPVFHAKVIEEYIEIFGQQGEILVERLSSQCGKGDFDVFKFITSCTLDIIFESALGESMSIQTSPESDYLRARHAILHIINMRLFKAWLQPDVLFNLTPYARQQKEYIEATHAFTDEIVLRKRKIYESEGIKENGSRKPMLELLFSKEFTNVQLREHIDSITIAGNDATALVLSYTLVLLGAHPHAQDKLYAELQEIFGDSNRQPDRQDMAKMDYMERVIKEAMRLFTVVPIIARTVETETKLSTCTIPAGSGCVIASYSMHRNKQVWGEDADSFDPDRFLPERSKGRHPCAYIPFSHGSRNCIGRLLGWYVMKTVITNVVRNFKIKSRVPDPSKLKIEILLFPIEGHQLSLEKRQRRCDTLRNPIRPVNS